MNNKLLRLWGKTDRHNSNRDAFHPALFHMLDVGNVARVLLSDKASPRWRKVLADALGAEKETLVDWLPWLVALHDVGKISEAFQEQNEIQKKRLVDEGIPFRKNVWDRKPHHSDVSEAAISVIAQSFSFPEELRDVWQATVSGHHGWFCGNERRGQITRDLQVEAEEWQSGETKTVNR